MSVDPDPDDVLLTTTGNQPTNVYHVTDECPRLAEARNVREITLRKNPFLKPCSWCDRNADTAAECGRQGVAE
jgi:hypothetical protein